MKTTRALKLSLLAVFLAHWPLGQVLGQPVSGPAQDPVAGSRVFGSKGCSKCHAINGVGGKIGPDLGRMPKPRTFFDLASAMWNHVPEMAAQMRKLGKPPPELTPRETGDLIAFLATVNYFDPDGNPKVGKKLFIDKQCVTCHQMERVGGVFGPSLDSVAQFGPIFFAAAMWNHGPAMTEAMQARGIKRPVFSGTELRDFIAYVKSVSRARGDQPIQVLPGRAEEGEKLFAARGCVYCHGVKGIGGPVGPALAGRKLYSSLFEFAAAMWNKGPAMAREMKRRIVPVPPLQADELADIVAYLYSVQYFAGAGDSRRGETLAKGKGCLGCHAISGKGRNIGPDFKKVAGLDQQAMIVAAMWNHAAPMEQKMAEMSVAWPLLKGSEMADLVSFIQTLGRSRE